jgi:putative transposase
VPDYRRNRVAGGTFFFTANLLDRRSGLLVEQIDALREAVRQVRARTPFHIDAWVVLPDHMHCVWTLPKGDADFPGRWRAIKKAFRNPFASASRDHRL